jgi:hypothetical protein
LKGPKGSWHFCILGFDILKFLKARSLQYWVRKSQSHETRHKEKSGVVVTLGIGISEFSISGISQTRSGKHHIRSPKIVKCEEPGKSNPWRRKPGSDILGYRDSAFQESRRLRVGAHGIKSSEEDCGHMKSGHMD